MKATAQIDDWCKFGDSLIGRVTNHSRQTSFKSPLQQTSKILRMDDKECETQNTVYTLGKPLQWTPYLS